ALQCRDRRGGVRRIHRAQGRPPDRSQRIQAATGRTGFESHEQSFWRRPPHSHRAAVSILMDPSSVAGLRRVDRTRLDASLARVIGALLIAILLAAPLLTGALRDQDFAWIQILGVVAAALWLARLWVNPAPIFLPP